MVSDNGAGPHGSPEPAGMRHSSVQRLRKLLRRKRERYLHQRFVVEGPKLVAEALACGLTVDQVFLGEAEIGGSIDVAAKSAGLDVVVVGDHVLEAVGSTVTPQPVYATIVMPPAGLDAGLTGLANRAVGTDEPFVLVLVDVADPGNAGTLLRAAEAAGVDLVIAAGETVDLFGPKCVRASAGSILRMPTAVGCSAVEALDCLAAMGVRRYASTLSATASMYDLDYSEPVALLVGNEAHGLQVDSAVLDKEIFIPMAGENESLNVAMAGTLMVYEVFRQRHLTK